MGGITSKVYDLAKMMHDQYELAAKETGWKTQESCHVDFDNLPKANQDTMLIVAHNVLIRISNMIRP